MELLMRPSSINSGPVTPEGSAAFKPSTADGDPKPNGLSPTASMAGRNINFGDFHKWWIQKMVGL